MAFYNGDKFVIQVETAPASGIFVDIACMRSTSLSINNEQIDTSAKCNTPWRQLIEGGIRSMSLSASGVFNDDSSLAIMMASAMNGTILLYKITSEAADIFDGTFQIASLERSGEYNDAEQYSISLESASDITYTP